jgi:hypothetical protein
MRKPVFHYLPVLNKKRKSNGNDKNERTPVDKNDCFVHCISG